MKKKLFIVFAIVLGFGFNAKSQNMGVVSRAAIYQSIPNFLSDLKMIDSLQGAYDKEISNESQRLQKQARDLILTYKPQENENLASIKKRMSTSDTMALKTILDKDDALAKKKETYDTKLTKMQKDKIDPALKRIDAAIKKISVQENLDVMYFLEDVNVGMAYLNERRNYTNAIIDELKK